MFRLRFTTSVQAPLTVAFDVARASGRSWSTSLLEVDSVRPHSDVHVAEASAGRGRVTATRRFTPTAEGTVVDERIEGESGRRGPLGLVADRVLRRRVERVVRADLATYVAAAEVRARDVVQVVGAALVDGDRVLVAQRSGGPYDGCWEFPGGKVEPGESQLAALARECAEELGVVVRAGDFLGEVPLDGVVGGGPRGASTMRVWAARIVSGEPVAHEHAALRWVTADELDDVEWIAADRPLLPAVRTLLGHP